MAAVLVAQSHVPAAGRAILPRRNQHPFPLRPWPRRHPGHPTPPGQTQQLPQRTTPASFASLVFLARFPGRRLTVRPSRYHHPQTSSVAHAASARAAVPAATTPSQPSSRTAFRFGGPRRRSAKA
jgi:hypothetical protein